MGSVRKIGIRNHEVHGLGDFGDFWDFGCTERKKKWKKDCR